MPETPSLGRANSLGNGTYTGGTGMSLGDGTPRREGALGRRKRPESLADWSPPTKVRLRTYADSVAADYAVPECNGHELLDTPYPVSVSFSYQVSQSRACTAPTRALTHYLPFDSLCMTQTPTFLDSVSLQHRDHLNNH
jgi:hypothetical protein